MIESWEKPSTVDVDFKIMAPFGPYVRMLSWACRHMFCKVAFVKTKFRRARGSWRATLKTNSGWQLKGAFIYPDEDNWREHVCWEQTASNWHTTVQIRVKSSVQLGKHLCYSSNFLLAASMPHGWQNSCAQLHLYRKPLRGCYYHVPEPPQTHSFGTLTA